MLRYTLPPDRRRAGRSQGLRDPLGIERLAEQLEARRALARAQGGEWPPPTPSPTSCGEDQLQLVVKKIQNPVSLHLN